MNRLPQLDFLRGIAVILVLFRHHWVGIDFLQRVGWIGVDLFFVLSGFLVSGLLFAEYKNKGSVQPVRFLARRGFKIYPLFYTSLILTLLLSPEITMDQIIGEAFFLQNYYDWFWGHHWSLAVEEHFYIAIALLAMFRPSDKRIVGLAAVVFVGCLLLRVFDLADAGATHGRADSLFMGVVISYIYHFHDLQKIYTKYKWLLFALALFPLSVANSARFTEITYGFTLIYIGCGALLIICLCGWKFDNWFTRRIGTVGFYSYGIYLFHLYPVKYLLGSSYLHEKEYTFTVETFLSFVVYIVTAIGAGMAASYLIEKPFLKLRDSVYPRRGPIAVSQA